ncbi:hypothetical protein [Massilia sp. DD77]|uniref:hypothetical protein n=1 Tax=Massilia sp. DD77 TaxID=3109349 RepID=UPI0030008DF5
MQHTLVAVFDNRTDAQNAMNELLSSGFSKGEVRLSAADPTGQTDPVTGESDIAGDRDLAHDRAGDTSNLGITASIKHFFSDLFGGDNPDHVSRYEGAVTRGHHVLTVTADSLPEVERAADIVERYGPTDIDEQASSFGEVPSGTGAMRMGSSSAMQSAPMSSQSQSPSQAQSGRGQNLQGGQAQQSQHSLDNPGDRKLFQQQSLNQAEPMGTTYQEPMGKSGLSATGGTSLQGSTLQENPVQASSLEGTPQGLGASAGSMTGSMRGSMSGPMAGSTTGNPIRSDSQQRGGVAAGGWATQQRGGSRIYSRGDMDQSGYSTGANMDDDSYFREHFSSAYSASGDSYDDYAPAYRYGSEMARGTYAGRKWNEVENDLRTHWESRTGNDTNSAWDRMKDAVRRGWDRITDDDDTHYRSHYASTYGSTGGAYDDYAPAYSYGARMRRDRRYSDRKWDDVETDLRTEWESSHAGSAWENMKAAVRRGWDRVTRDDDNDSYRSHYSSTYEGSGVAYDAVAPAYAYGSQMRGDSRYANRQWDEVEGDLRTDWETRNPGSTWENMKAAVRRGWDRMTGDDDEDYYRSHYSSTYGASGKDYDEYEPAYSYGTEMARSETYRNRPWDEAMPSLRSDWEARQASGARMDADGTKAVASSAWEDMKDAVRHGWNRMTNAFSDTDEDSYYRSHYRSHYGSAVGGAGDSYDTYRPAYEYGSSMRRDPQYSSREWDDALENELRSGWQSRYPGGPSTWDKVKEAVRHGWNRLTY